MNKKALIMLIFAFFLISTILPQASAQEDLTINIDAPREVSLGDEMNISVSVLIPEIAGKWKKEFPLRLSFYADGNPFVTVHCTRTLINDKARYSYSEPYTFKKPGVHTIKVKGKAIAKNATFRGSKTVNIEAKVASISVRPSHAGSISFHLVENNKAEVTAKPYIGYEFNNWSGDIPPRRENENTIKIVPDLDKSLTAHFRRKSPKAPYKLISRKTLYTLIGDYPFAWNNYRDVISFGILKEIRYKKQLASHYHKVGEKKKGFDAFNQHMESIQRHTESALSEATGYLSKKISPKRVAARAIASSTSINPLYKVYSTAEWHSTMMDISKEFRAITEEAVTMLRDARDADYEQPISKKSESLEGLSMSSLYTAQALKYYKYLSEFGNPQTKERAKLYLDYLKEYPKIQRGDAPIVRWNAEEIHGTHVGGGPFEDLSSLDELRKDLPLHAKLDKYRISGKKHLKFNKMRSIGSEMSDKLESIVNEYHEFKKYYNNGNSRLFSFRRFYKEIDGKKPLFEEAFPELKQRIMYIRDLLETAESLDKNKFSEGSEGRYYYVDTVTKINALKKLDKAFTSSEEFAAHLRRQINFLREEIDEKKSSFKDKEELYKRVLITIGIFICALILAVVYWKGRKALWVLVVLLTIIALTIVTSALRMPASKPETIADESFHIGDGNSVSYNLRRGRYRVKIDSDDVLKIRFVGGGVPNKFNSVSHLTVGYSGEIERLPSSESPLEVGPAVLKIRNPLGGYSGFAANVHITITETGD